MERSKTTNLFLQETDMRKCFYRLKAEIDSLTVFSDIKDDPAIAGLHKLLEAMADRDTDLSIKRYSQFVS